MSENIEAKPEIPAETQGTAKKHSTRKAIIGIIVLGTLGLTAIIRYGGFVKRDSVTKKTLIETYAATSKSPGLEFIRYAISNAFNSGSDSKKEIS